MVEYGSEDPLLQVYRKAEEIVRKEWGETWTRKCFLGEAVPDKETGRWHICVFTTSRMMNPRKDSPEHHAGSIADVFIDKSLERGEIKVTGASWLTSEEELDLRRIEQQKLKEQKKEG